MTVQLLTAGDGELIANGPVKIRIIEDGTNVGHRLGLTEVRLAPAAPGPPQHVHRAHEETFYVVSGVVRFTSGEQATDMTAGGLLTAPIGAPHTFANPDPDEPAVLLVTYTPDRYIQYFREIGAMGAGPGGIDEAADLDLMSKYATEPYRRNG